MREWGEQRFGNQTNQLEDQSCHSLSFTFLFCKMGLLYLLLHGSREDSVRLSMSNPFTEDSQQMITDISQPQTPSSSLSSLSLPRSFRLSSPHPNSTPLGQSFGIAGSPQLYTRNSRVALAVRTTKLMLSAPKCGFPEFSAWLN